tara:strand:- start:248 stop:1234 length:987 start_codon:yes stop_codon:yes gene_type:complete
MDIQQEGAQAIIPSLPYLVELTQRLALGLGHLSTKERQVHCDYFWAQQQTDGGFCGRTTASDLYYTSFALRGLVILGDEYSERAQHAAVYLRDRSQSQASVIDLISLVFASRLLESWTGLSVFEDNSRWPGQVVANLEQLRRADGGYAKSKEGHASSTYQTFLISLTYQLLEIPQPDFQRAVEFVLSQQRDDGGFVEIGVMRRSGTNPTAAAVGVLKILDPLRIEQIRLSVTHYLLGNQTDEGGLRANTQIPIADLLSTYTGLQTLHDIGSADQIDTADVLSYVQSLQQPEGGFFAANWDAIADVEYSFYGVALLGLLIGKRTNEKTG